MKNKETGNKKHKVRRTFIVTAIVTALAVIGGVVTTAFLPTPLLLLSEACFLTAGVTAVVGTGVGINAIYSSRSVAHNRKQSIKSLQQIAEGDLSLSREQRVKIAKKYANANLRLCSLIGCPLCGKFHSVSGMDTTARTEAFNALENLELLQALETTEKGRKKWEPKIAQKRKIVASACMKSVPHRWTRSYDDFIDGVSIYDRRTEIGCLSPKTGEEFERLVELMPNTDELGATVSLTFKPTCRTQQTYARVADPTLAPEVARLMLQDVLLACDGKTPAEIETMFPFVLRTHTIDKKSSTIKNVTPQVIRSLDQLKTELGVTDEVVR